MGDLVQLMDFHPTVMDNFGPLNADLTLRKSDDVTSAYG